MSEKLPCPICEVIQKTAEKTEAEYKKCACSDTPEQPFPQKGDNPALIVFYQGEGLVVVSELQSHVDRFVREITSIEGSAFTLDPGGDYEMTGIAKPGEALPDGVYLANIYIADDGAESWEMPHIRDYVLGVDVKRAATTQEWMDHLQGNWPWEPIYPESNEREPLKDITGCDT